jgi:hypothetical protein
MDGGLSTYSVGKLGMSATRIIGKRTLLAVVISYEGGLGFAKGAQELQGQARCRARRYSYFVTI